MRILLQRVTEGSVTVGHETIGRINRGYVLLAGIGDGDDRSTVDRMAEKVVRLRLFNNEAGKVDRSLLDVAGAALVISQFTLFGDTRKGRRPSFVAAARPEVASPLCERFAERLRSLGVSHVATGRFGADMQVRIHNDGPVTLWLDSAEWS